LRRQDFGIPLRHLPQGVTKYADGKEVGKLCGGRCALIGQVGGGNDASGR